MNYQRGGHAPYKQNPSAPSTDHASSQPPRGVVYDVTSHSQKRNHATAFKDRPNDAARNHRPLAPPAVPSFGIDLDNLLPKKPEPHKQSSKGPAKKPNLLGLTPVARDEDSEEDDAEEEGKLASTISPDSLQIEYKGQTSTLNTPEEVAAWIAERRKKWPTEQKRETAQKEAEDRKKRWEAEKTVRMEVSKASAKARYEERLKQKVEKEKSQIRQKLLREHIQKAKAVSVTDGTQTAAQAKAEKLRRKAEKIALQLQIAEAALDKNEGIVDGGSATEPDLDTLLVQVDTIASAQENHANVAGIPDNASNTSDASSVDSDAIMGDDTSTSGSSGTGSDSDAAPEEFTTKRLAPDRVLPPARKVLAGSSDTRPLCKNFAQSGRCKFGRKCHFKHEKPGKKVESISGKRRKGLFQLMVEKEQEGERERALRMIIALGDAGVLDEPLQNERNAAAL